MLSPSVRDFFVFAFSFSSIRASQEQGAFKKKVKIADCLDFCCTFVIDSGEKSR